MSDLENTTHALPLPTTPATTVDPRAIEALLEKEALSLTDEDLASLVSYFRTLRKQAAIDSQTRPARAKAVAGGKKKLTAEEAANLTLDDLGL